MLSINISEVIWTVIDFLVLYFVLKKLLYDPLRSFMAQRKAKTDALTAQKTDALAEAELIRRKNDELKAAAEEEARRRIAAESEQESREQSEALRQARQSSEDARRAIREEAELFRTRERQALDSRGEELARALAEKLLG